MDKEPTCTENGSQSIHCKDCDVVKDSEVIQALGHDLGEWKTTKEPTETEKGEKVRKCSRCDTEEKEILPMLEKGTGKDTQSKDNSSVETGDRTNILLWVLLFISSCLCILSVLYRKKQKSNQ